MAVTDSKRHGRDWSKTSGGGGEGGVEVGEGLAVM